MKFVNKTGYQIDNFSYNNKDLGTLKKNASVTFKMDSLELYVNTPLGAPYGSIKGVSILLESGSVSADKVTVVRNGNYEFDVVLTKDKFSNDFKLNFKSRKT